MSVSRKGRGQELEAETFFHGGILDLGHAWSIESARSFSDMGEYALEDPATSLCNSHDIHLGGVIGLHSGVWTRRKDR